MLIPTCDSAVEHKEKKKINENGKPVNELADDTQRRLGRIQTKVGEEPIVYY